MTFEFDKSGFLKRLRATAHAKGEKNLMLAHRCNLPFPTFEGYLYGQNTPTAGKFAQLCAGLNISADWLLFGVGQNTEQNDKFSRYRFIQNGLPIAEFSGVTDKVLQDVNDYIANYEADVPAVVEMHLNDQWKRLAWIGVNHVGGSNAG